MVSKEVLTGDLDAWAIVVKKDFAMLLQFFRRYQQLGVREMYKTLLIVVFMLLAFSFASAQEIAPDDVIRVKTTLVNSPVLVIGRDGRFVPNLRREDFEIYENGVK